MTRQTLPDKRIQFNNQLIQHEGNAWRIDAKYDPSTHKLKIYSVHGDITNKLLLEDAIRLFMDAELLKRSV